MKYYVYILKSRKIEKHYIGYTNNLERRITEHNSGKSKFTRGYIPWDVVYFEECESQEETIKREKYYKSASGRRKLKKILSPGSSVG